MIFDINHFPKNIFVVGAGYVGLPLGLAMAQYFPTTICDINAQLIKRLRNTYPPDHNNHPHFTTGISEAPPHSLFTITVQTPLQQTTQTPDLSFIENACRMVGSVLKPGSVVVLESTVYPGVTEEICLPLLEKISSLKARKDFHIAYAPERINPGDSEHSTCRITKVIAAQDPLIAEHLGIIYGKLNEKQIHIAKNIRVAEASKLLENTQRDMNIALMNELAPIFASAGLSIFDILETAQTKWNFSLYTPGLVGGHCISVDPFYLVHFAQQYGYSADLICLARKTNQRVSQKIVEKILTLSPGGGKILVLGLSFKENIPDVRNSCIISTIENLHNHGYHVRFYDPIADFSAPEYIHLQSYQTHNYTEEAYNLVIYAKAHTIYEEIDFNTLLKKDGILLDLTGKKRNTKNNFLYCSF